MLMSKQQQYALEIIQKLGCVRKRQLDALLSARFADDLHPISSRMVDALLRQMQYRNIDLRLDDEIVSLPGRSNSPFLLEAVDVMLELADGAPLDFSAARDESVLLRFSLGSDRIVLFVVIHSDSFSGTGVRSPPTISKNVRIIVLLDSEISPPIISLPNKLFYAVKQDDGTHRFLAAHQ